MNVAAYCRVSTDKEDQWNSLESQKAYFEQYIQRHPDWELYKIYADEGISGTGTKKRAAFNRMMNDAYDGKFSLILTKEVSRFSRNILDTISYTRELRSMGVHVYFMSDGFGTQDADCELRLTYMSSSAQEESRKTSMRVTWGQQRQMEKGVVFGRSMLGYDVEGGKMTVNPDGAELVRLIFHKYAVEQVSTGKLANWLREQGHRTLTGSTKWTPQQIIKILRNEKYVGDLIQRKTYTPDYLTHEKKANHGQVEKIILRNHHEPIIDRELWEQAQSRLDQNNKHEEGSEVHSNSHLFSGKIRCGCCGGGFVSRVKSTAQGQYRRWSCAKAVTEGALEYVDANGNAMGCGVGRLVRDDDALNMTQTALKALQIDWEDVVGHVASLALEAIQAGQSNVSDTPERLEFEMEKLREKKERIMDAYLDGAFSKDEMLAMKGKYDAQIEALTDRLAVAEERQKNGTDRAQLKQSLCKKLTALLRGEQESEVLYKTILDKITVFKDRHMELTLSGLSQVYVFS